MAVSCDAVCEGVHHLLLKEWFLSTIVDVKMLYSYVIRE